MKPRTFSFIYYIIIVPRQYTITFVNKMLKRTQIYIHINQLIDVDDGEHEQYLMARCALWSRMFN